METIFKCLAGSRLYGTYNENSDTDYKAVHLPSKREILLGRVPEVVSTSTGQSDEKNGADDTDVESFALQRFLKLASDMQTIPVEMLFVPDGITQNGPDDYRVEWEYGPVWMEIIANRDKILNRNTKSFVGYCKGQAVRYSLRGKRLETFIAVHHFFAQQNGMAKDRIDLRGMKRLGQLGDLPGVKYVEKEHCGTMVMYLDVYGRQVPDNVRNLEAEAIFAKPVAEAGRRANEAMVAGGADWKALYHAVRIVEQGIMLFRDGIIEFPARNRDFLVEIRSGEVEMDAILDYFDEKLAILEEVGEKSPLAAHPDRLWIDDFVAEQYERIVRA